MATSTVNRPTGIRPTGNAKPNGRAKAMAKQESAETEQVQTEGTVNSDGFPVEVQGREAGKRGRKPGTQNRTPVLTASTTRNLSASDLGISLTDAIGMVTKQTGGGRKPEERSEIQRQYDADILDAFREWYDANNEAIDNGEWPTDAPENRLPHFAVVENVTWNTRTVEHTADVAEKLGRTSTEVTESPELMEAGRYLTNARDFLRKEYPQLVLHVYAPRPHVDGSHLIPWSVYAREEDSD